jgi:GNAT superfamily N-acetyltransferase
MTPIPRHTLRDSPALTLRPVNEHDAPALNALIGGLSEPDRRARFHGAVSGVSEFRLERMTRVDSCRELALVASVRGRFGDALIADARCVIDATGHDAEFALMVATAWRGRGIGALVLDALRRAASQRGLRWLYGSVLADNTAMLALVRRCGFCCTPHRGDRQRVVVETCLQPAGHALPA